MYAIRNCHIFGRFFIRELNVRLSVAHVTGGDIFDLVTNVIIDSWLYQNQETLHTTFFASMIYLQKKIVIFRGYDDHVDFLSNKVILQILNFIKATYLVAAFTSYLLDIILQGFNSNLIWFYSIAFLPDRIYIRTHIDQNTISVFKSQLDIFFVSYMQRIKGAANSYNTFLMTVSTKHCCRPMDAVDAVLAIPAV